MSDDLAQESINAAELNNRANTLWELGRVDEALKVFEQINKDAPRYALAHLNRGLLLAELRHHDAAITSLDAAINCQPDLVAAHVSKFRLLAKWDRHDAAIKACREFLDLTATHDSISLEAQQEATFSLAHLLLTVGAYGEAFQLYEMRRHAEFLNPRVIHAPPLSPDTSWLGGSPLQGKRILIWHEQGMGDTLQFCRYISVLIAKGAQVICEVPSGLVPLLSHSFPTVEVVCEENFTHITFDYHCPMMSLPLACGTASIEAIPARIPYLFSDPVKRQIWCDRLNEHLGPEQNKLRVGLVWAGGAGFKYYNQERDMPLAGLVSLKHPNIHFISLQKGEPAEQELADLQAQGWDGPAITSYSEHLHDFSNTAALIDNLDLVIAVDTSVAHLAGAMGKPVWILNRFDACWRWLYGQDPNRTDSPWYPTARLFRQPKAGDWYSVIEQVREMMSKWAIKALKSQACAFP